MVYIGVDIGTQSARAVAADQNGNILAAESFVFEQINIASGDKKEQNPQHWYDAVCNCLQSVCKQLKNNGNFDHISAVALDGTSGTIVALDANNNPLTNGIMYNDPRAKEQAPIVQAAAGDIAKKLGYAFNSSYALVRMLWIKQCADEIYQKTARMVAQSDYIVGKLTGDFAVSDYSNVLKTGYDIIDNCWPEYIGNLIDISMLPRVVAPGTIIGSITQAASEQTGLKAGTAVVAGCTDGYASAIASGAVNVGEFNTTIGTTLVIKGVTKNIITDNLGRVYCHKHPQGYYMPGGAGNVGGLCVNEFGKENFNTLNANVLDVVPTGSVVYPLTGKGERFPFVCPNAEKFEENVFDDQLKRYAATLEGVAFVERLSYDLLKSLGCQIGDTIYIAGGAVKSPQWSKIRASVLNKRLAQPENVDAAMGSCVIAAMSSGTTLIDTAKKMVRYCAHFEPEAQLVTKYNDIFGEFVNQCAKRGYM